MGYTSTGGTTPDAPSVEDVPGDQLTFDNPLQRYGRVEPPLQHQDEPAVQGRMSPVPDLGEDSYRGTGRLIGRKALITGGDSGIGGATAIAFAREGADVAIVHRAGEEADAEHVLAQIAAAGRTGHAVVADLSRAEDCQRVVASALDALDGLDILVSNAGKQTAVASVLDLSDEQMVHFDDESTYERAGQPAEIAPAFVFLASAESSYVSGETLNVNGGMVTP